MPRSRVPFSPEGHFRSWMLLAPARKLCPRANAEIQKGILGAETGGQSTTRYYERGALASFGWGLPGWPSLSTVGSITYQPSLRSFHVGLVLSIKAIFFARIHPLSCFSRAIALSGPVNRSNQTSRLQLYFDENPS